jgi:chromate transporter
MVNMATFVGSTQGGILGAFVSTFAVVLPAFVIILVLMAVLSHVLKSPWVKAALGGINPCIIGIILFTGAQMTLSNCFSAENAGAIDVRALLVTGILVAASAVYKAIRKKKISPILLIGISACFGIIVWGI